MKFYQLADIKDHKLIVNKDKMDALIQILYDGRYLITFQRLDPKSTIKDYRRCYFAKIDALGFETGHTRYEMHALVKDELLSKIIDQLPELVEDEIITTKNLTEESWGVLLEALDLWAFTEYSVILN